MCIAAIIICHQCPERQKGCNGPCACTIDGRDIIEHAESRQCPKGKFPADMDCSNQPPAMQPETPKPIPREEWPKWASIIAAMANEKDVGVGDTISRELGIIGEAFKATLAAMGVPCGCGDRQSQFNFLYPYGRTPPT